MFKLVSSENLGSIDRLYVVIRSANIGLLVTRTFVTRTLMVRWCRGVSHPCDWLLYLFSFLSFFQSHCTTSFLFFLLRMFTSPKFVFQNHWKNKTYRHWGASIHWDHDAYVWSVTLYAQCSGILILYIPPPSRNSLEDIQEIDLVRSAEYTKHFRQLLRV